MVNSGSALLASALILPVLLAALGAHPAWRPGVLRWLWVVPLPGLVAALLATGGPGFSLGWEPWRLAFEPDLTGALLLLAASLLWSLAGLYLPAWFGRNDPGAGFLACWLLTMAGSLGIFWSADPAGFLLLYALVGLPPYGLILRGGTARSVRAGRLFAYAALLGEGLVILGLVQLVTGVSVSGAPVCTALLLAGFGLKMGLVPGHFWMPPAYSAAPIPAAAVLSGVGVKAGLIGLIRFLPPGTVEGDWGGLLVVLGLVGAYGGVFAGLAQTNPKTVLAWSSVSQMGLLAAVLGTAWISGAAGAGILLAFYAANHVLVKGGLFLAVGVRQPVGARRTWLVLIPAALVGLSLAGLPFTGGALAKLVIKSPLGDGLTALLATWSAAGTALLLLHFVRCLSLRVRSTEPALPGLTGPWLLLALLCLVAPWAVAAWAGLPAPETADFLKTLGPVLAGGVLFLLLVRHKLLPLPLRFARVKALLRAVAGLPHGAGAAAAGVDGLVRRWPVACCLLVVLVPLLAWALSR